MRRKISKYNWKGNHKLHKNVDQEIEMLQLMLIHSLEALGDSLVLPLEAEQKIFCICKSVHKCFKNLTFFENNFLSKNEKITTSA